MGTEPLLLGKDNHSQRSTELRTKASLEPQCRRCSVVGSSARARTEHATDSRRGAGVQEACRPQRRRKRREEVEVWCSTRLTPSPRGSGTRVDGRRTDGSSMVEAARSLESHRVQMRLFCGSLSCTLTQLGFCREVWALAEKASGLRRLCSARMNMVCSVLAFAAAM